jgi:hypothetical protein
MNQGSRNIELIVANDWQEEVEKNDGGNKQDVRHSSGHR